MYRNSKYVIEFKKTKNSKVGYLGKIVEIFSVSGQPKTKPMSHKNS